MKVTETRIADGVRYVKVQADPFWISQRELRLLVDQAQRSGLEIEAVVYSAAIREAAAFGTSPAAWKAH